MNYIRRGTTPSHEFVLPAELTEIIFDVLYITYKQVNRIVMEKTLESEGVTRSGNVITVRLTQAETLAFQADDAPVSIQIRLRTAAGDALVSDVMTVGVGAIIKDGVI